MCRLIDNTIRLRRATRVALLVALCFTTACTEEDDDPTWRDLPKQEISGNDLSLTTNGQPQVNAGVTLDMTDRNSGMLTLRRAGLGLDEVNIGVTVKGQTGGEVYALKGSVVAQGTDALTASTVVTVSGNVMTDGRANVEVTTEAVGALVRQWPLCDKLYPATGDPFRRPYAPARIYMLSTYNNGTTAENISNLGTSILSAIMVKLLKDVDFRSNGNIIATFGKNPTIDTNDIISGVLGVLPSTAGVNWTTSPADYAYWFMKDNRLNVQLNYSNLLNKVMERQETETRNTVILSELLELVRGVSGAEIKSLVAGLIESYTDEDSVWRKLDIDRIADKDVERLVGYLIDGIPLNYETSKVTKTDGSTTDNLYVYLDKEFFDMLMPLVFPFLPEIDAMLDNLDMDLLGTPVGDFIKQMLGVQSMTDFEEVWRQTTVFKVGLDLSTGSHK